MHQSTILWNAQKPSLCEQTWFILLMLFLFWPYGIYLVWKRAHWPIAARIFVTVLIVGYVTALGVSVLGSGG